MKHSKPRFVLTINDPREGWAHATDLECKTLAEVWAHVTIKRAEHKRFQFMLCVQGLDKTTTYHLKRGKFVGIVDGWKEITRAMAGAK